MRCILLGNYGVGNLGDELLREYFVRRFPDVEWIVVSARPQEPHEVPRLPLGVRSLFVPWWRTIRAIASADAVVCGGGTLFSDVESVVACVLWGWHVLVARLFRKPVFLAFQGIGPFRTRLGRWCGWRVLRSARFVSVRDAASHRRALFLVGDLGILQTFDPVFLLLEEHPSPRAGGSLVIIPRTDPPEGFAPRALELRGSGRYSSVRILSFQPDNAAERKICRALQVYLPEADLLEVRTAEEARSALAGTGIVLTARYHGAVAALALGVPFETVAQAREDKLSTLPASEVRQSLRALVERGEAALREALRKYSVK